MEKHLLFTMRKGSRTKAKRIYINHPSKKTKLLFENEKKKKRFQPNDTFLTIRRLRETKAYLPVSLLQQVLHYILPNYSFKTPYSTNVVCTCHFRTPDTQVSVLGNRPSGPWWSHHHWNCRQCFSPCISWRGEQMPARILVSGCLNAPRACRLPFHVHVWVSTIWGFHWWGRTDLSRRFHPVQPS